ncbi:hypothetical protein GCM10020331_015980 [Ectobacillus funiculus]
MKNAGFSAFGVMKNAAQITYYGLHSLQHRGQEGAGIVVSNEEKLVGHKGLGLVTEVFSQGQLEKAKRKKLLLDMFATQQQEEAVTKTCSRFCSVRS